MKKLFLLIFLAFLLVGTVSAWDFDNTYNYDSETETVTIHNCDFWIGTCLNTGEVLTTLDLIWGDTKVGAGTDTHVGTFGITFESDYSEDVFSNLGLINMKNGQVMTRGKQYKVKINKTKDIFEYQCEVVNTLGNGTQITECNNVEVGTEVVEEWTPITNPNFQFVNGVYYEIGIFVDTEIGDYGDWKPSLLGITIDEWSTWTVDLNTDIVSYWKLDNNNFTDELGVNTLSNVNTANNSGIILDGRDFGLANSRLDGTDGPTLMEYSANTLNFWFKRNNTGNQMLVWKQAASVGFFVQFEADNQFNYGIGTVDTGNINPAVTDTSWHMLTYIYDNDAGSNNLQLYLDGNSIDNTTGTSNIVADGVNMRFGLDGADARDFDGIIDEVGIWNRTLSTDEITQLYNSGAGISYTNDFNTAPVITGYNSSANYSSVGTYDFVYNAYDDQQLNNVSIYINGVLNQTNSSGINNTDYTFSVPLNEGTYTILGSAVDNASAQTNTSEITIIIDSTNPLVSIANPSGSYNYASLGDSVEVNFSATDTYLDDCWYDYNGTNVTTGNCANFSIALQENNYNITVYANDTFGNLGSATSSWKYLLVENSETFSNPVLETSAETFIVNVTYNSTLHPVISSTLNYNGTAYAGTKSGSGNTVTFNRLVNIPDVSADEITTFYWNIALTNSSGTTYINTTSNTQNISVINMSLCDAPHTIPFINFTAYDETTLNEINVTFQGTFTYTALDSSTENTFSYSDSTGNYSQFDFCMDPSEYSYNVDTNIEVSATGYVTKFFNWEGLTLSNTTTEKDFYMLSENLSTSFIIEVIDYGATPIVGASVKIEAYYPGIGEWLVTEVVTTNYEGKAIGHLYSEDVEYRFKVYESGVSTYNSSATKIFCEETPCTVQLIVPGSIGSETDLPDELEYTLTYTESTNIFTFTYTDTSGLFSSSELEVKRFDLSNVSNNVAVCTQTSTTSSAVVTCDISSEVNGTYVARGYIYRSDTGKNLIDTLYGIVGDTIYNRIGIEGVLWAFFLFMGIVMVGALKPALAIVMAVVGIVFLTMLNIVAIGITATVSLIAIGVIMLLQIKK